MIHVFQFFRLSRLNEIMGYYSVQNCLFFLAIVVMAWGVISGLLTVTYIGSSWVLGSLLSPMFGAQTILPQTVIGVASGLLFTYVSWLLWSFGTS